MYNPYQGQGAAQTLSASQGQGAYYAQQSQHQSQQQAPFGGNQFSQQQGNVGNGNYLNGAVNGTPLNSFFNDPAAQMGLQFSQSAFNASQQYMQNNLQQFVSNEDIKYYFKVSNSYVFKKLMLILFPYRNKSWVRQLKPSATDPSANEIYATPVDDVNAPDLYIPTMAFLSYILVWALGEGVKGDFHPELLGYATTRTLAFYLLDLIVLRVSFYILGISSRNSKIWDLVSYTGYKFVPIFVMLLFQTLVNDSSLLLKYFFMSILCFSLGFFMMRTLRYVVLPNGGFGGENRMRLQYLFAYCFVVQGLFLWLMV